jgi:putative endonuclease
MSNKSRRLYIGIHEPASKTRLSTQKQAFAGIHLPPHLRHARLFRGVLEVVSAISREKYLKGWTREKKLKLILSENPDWEDLSQEWFENPLWQAIPEAEFHPVLKRKPVS